MSASLVRKALEIFDSADTDVAEKSVSKEKSHKSNKVKKKKGLQSIKKKVGGDSRAANLVRKTQKGARADQDRTQENLEVLLSLSKEKHSKFTSGILERTGRTTAPKETAPVSTSVFTEEDFAKFEQEYFVN